MKFLNQHNLRTRTSYLKLICPFRKTKTEQNALFFIGPPLWSNTPEVLKKKKQKKNNNINIFKHKLKKKKKLQNTT